MHTSPDDETERPKTRDDDLPSSLTVLLERSRRGDPDATSRLVDHVYDELIGLARGLCHSGPDATMSATVLVHEAFVRMRGAANNGFETRRQFYAFAAKIMRHVLVDHARKRQTQKRGGDVELFSLEEAHEAVGTARFDWLELDEALSALSNRDARLGRIVELRFFGGLSTEEAAIELGISPGVANREWRLAKAWLKRELSREEQPE